MINNYNTLLRQSELLSNLSGYPVSLTSMIFPAVGRGPNNRGGGSTNRRYRITVMESLVDKKGRGEIWHDTSLICKRPDFFPIGLV